MKMLLSQVSEEKKEKLSVQVGLNLGIFNTKITADSQPNEDGNNIAKIGLICDELEKQGEIGNLEFPGEWIKDEMEVKYLRVKENPNLFIMVGKKNEKYHLLGGSSHHVIGNEKPKDAHLGYSFFPYLVEELEKSFSEEHDNYIQMQKDVLGVGFEGNEFIPGINEKEWSDTIYRLYNDSDNIIFSVEFFARYYGEGKSLYGSFCTLSSPIYVYQK